MRLRRAPNWLRMFFILNGIFVAACDPYHHQKCEWFLDPDLEHKDIASPGHVAICLRNFVTGRQKCFLEMPLKDAEAVFRRPTRYSAMTVNTKLFPRRITEYETCSGASYPEGGTTPHLK